MRKLFIVAYLAVAISVPARAFEDTDIVCDNGLAIRFDRDGLSPIVVDAEGRAVTSLRECSVGPAPCFTFEKREEQYNLFWLQMEKGGDMQRCPAVEGF
jgi:hypothetical protein